MKLTTDGLQRFVGGQIEIIKVFMGSLERGEIAKIHIEEGYGLIIETSWMANCESYPESRDYWVASLNTSYQAPFNLFSFADEAAGQVSAISSHTGECVMLYPKGGKTLDRSKVLGL